MRATSTLLTCTLWLLASCTGTLDAPDANDRNDAPGLDARRSFETGSGEDAFTSTEDTGPSTEDASRSMEDAWTTEDASASSDAPVLVDSASPLGDYAPDDGPEAGGGRVVAVSTAAQLVAAIAAANPGDEITLADGTYALDGTVAVTRPGTADGRIFVRAQNPQRATITVCADIGFRIDAPFWIFENLVLRSRCTSVSDHAFQVIGRGDDFILRRNRSEDFFAHVKLNGTGGLWPDRFWAIDNDFRDSMAIPADGPFNVLNIDGGNAHVIRGNRFVDIAVSTARHASSIYLKATTRDAIIEENMVVCLRTLTSTGPTRGIWGGDQTGTGGICDGDCANVRNINRNNIVLNCQGGSGNRFGLGSSNERDVVYLHNLVHRVTQNFYVGSNPGPVLFRANLLYADFLITAGEGRPTLEANTMIGAAGMTALYANPDAADFALRAGESLLRVARDDRAPHDFCRHARGAMTDIGPIDYGHPRAADCVARIRTIYEGL